MKLPVNKKILNMDDNRDIKINSPIKNRRLQCNPSATMNLIVLQERYYYSNFQCILTVKKLIETLTGVR